MAYCRTASSGYYKYRCKNFFTHNCGNWVWVNNSACAECVAAGRESDSDSLFPAIDGPTSSPTIDDGIISYILHLGCTSSLHEVGVRDIQHFEREIDEFL